MNWLGRQIREIQGSDVLIYYGAFLCAALVINAVEWIRIGAAFREPIHWPIVSFAEALHPYAALLTWAMLLSAAVGVIVFALLKRADWGYGLLAAALAFKLSLFFQDYGYMGNYHLMQHWLVLAYLVWPRKTLALPLLIVVFYFFAGTLKFNDEWLTGATLLRLPPLPMAVLTPLLYLVIPLEIAVVWFFLIGPPWARWGTLGLYVFFHVFSYWVVGYYYPAQMFASWRFFRCYGGGRSEGENTTLSRSCPRFCFPSRI